MRKGPQYECETDSPNDGRDQWSVSHHVTLSPDRNQPAAADYSLPRAAGRDQQLVEGIPTAPGAGRLGIRPHPRRRRDRVGVARLVSSGDDRVLASHRSEATVVFCDLRNFTAIAEKAEPEEVMTVLREYHSV
jgi:hypothetical protein